LNFDDCVAPITVETFLSTLCGTKNNLDNIIGSQWTKSDQGVFLRGIINFTHFSYVTYAPRFVDLERFFASSAAVLCRRGQDVYDLVIPVHLAQKKRMTCIVVQVKNYTEGRGLPQIPEDLLYQGGMKKDAGEQTNDPFLYLFMQMGPRQPLSCRLYMKTNGQLVVNHSKDTIHGPNKCCLMGIFGISTSIFPFLTKAICDGLNTVSLAWLDPLMVAWHSDKKGIEILQELLELNSEPGREESSGPKRESYGADTGSSKRRRSK